VDALKIENQNNYRYSLVDSKTLPHPLGSQHRQRKTLPQDQQGDELQHCQ